MSSLRRSKTFTPDGQTVKFLYTILKQLDLKTVDWTLVAEALDITNGHAARMRYSRLKQQIEGPSGSSRASKPRKMRRYHNGEKHQGKEHIPKSLEHLTDMKEDYTADIGELTFPFASSTIKDEHDFQFNNFPLQEHQRYPLPYGIPHDRQSYWNRPDHGFAQATYSTWPASINPNTIRSFVTASPLHNSSLDPPVSMISMPNIERSSPTRFLPLYPYHNDDALWYGPNSQAAQAMEITQDGSKIKNEQQEKQVSGPDILMETATAIQPGHEGVKIKPEQHELVVFKSN